jgi:hypothetical protein
MAKKKKKRTVDLIKYKNLPFPLTGSRPRRGPMCFFTSRMVQPDWRKMDRLPPFIDLMTICREGEKITTTKQFSD